jgi:hypothetical protein
LNVRGLFSINKNHCKLIIWTGRSFCQTGTKMVTPYVNNILYTAT